MNIIDLRCTWKSVLIGVLLTVLTFVLWQWTSHVEASSTSRREICINSGRSNNGKSEAIGYRLYEYTDNDTIRAVNHNGYATNATPEGSKLCFTTTYRLKDNTKYHLAFTRWYDVFGLRTDYLADNVGISVGTADSINVAFTLREGDVNGDGTINQVDMDIIVSSLDIFSTICSGDNNYDRRADLDEDGCITGTDSSIFLSYYKHFNLEKEDSCIDGVMIEGTPANPCVISNKRNRTDIPPGYTVPGIGGN